MAKKRNNQQRRRKQRPRRRTPKQSKSLGLRMQPHDVPSNIVEKVCSNYDPFCQAAFGGKLFDENTAPSLTYQNRSVVSVTTDATGQFVCWINNSPTNYINYGTIDGSGNVSAWVSNNSAFYSLLGTANISQWRIVSSGVRYFTTQAWTSATGYGNITEMTEPFGGATGQSASSVRWGPRMKTFALRDANATMVCRSKGMQSRSYKSVTDQDTGYTGTVFYFTGTASTTIGYLELVTNYEWIADPYTAYQVLASPAAAHSKTVLDSVTHLATNTNNIRTFSDQIDSAASFMKDAKEAVKKTSGLIEDIGAIGGMIYPPLRGAGGIGHALRYLTN